MKLATKSVIPYLFILVFGVLLFGTLIYNSKKEVINNNILDDAHDAANELAKEIVNAHYTATMLTYQRILTKYLKLPNAVYAVVFSMDRNINFPIYNEGYNSAELRKDIFSVSNIKHLKFERTIDYKDGEALYEVSAPVIIPKVYFKELTPEQDILILSEKKFENYDFPEFLEQMLFVVKYAVTFKKVDSLALAAIKLPVLLFLVGMIFVLAIVHRYEEYILAPLYTLISATKRFDKESRHKLSEINADDEFMTLSENVIEMYEKAQNSINNLNLANEYAQSLISSPSISSLFDTIVFEILRLKGIEKGGLLYWNEKRARFVIKETNNFGGIHKVIGNDENFIKWYLENRTVLDPENFLKNFKNYNKPEIRRWADHGIEVIIPMFQHEKVVGFLNMGKLRSLKEYTKEDIKYFKSLAQIAVIAVENLNLRLREAQNLVIKKDLDFAKDVQKKLLPSDTPHLRGVEFALSMSPARNIGGDYYDFIYLEDSNTGISIADVSGKGVSAALVMASTRSYLRLIAKDNYDCRDILNRLNALLISDTGKKMFVTMFYSILNVEKKKLCFANAGHNYPLLYKAREKKAVYIQTNGFPLGMVADFGYDFSEIELESGDMLIYYTDGIVEALNENKEFFGFARLESALNLYGSMTADEFITEFMKDFKVFIGEEDLMDDYTIMAIKIT